MEDEAFNLLSEKIKVPLSQKKKTKTNNEKNKQTKKDHMKPFNKTPH